MKKAQASSLKKAADLRTREKRKQTDAATATATKATDPGRAARAKKDAAAATTEATRFGRDAAAYEKKAPIRAPKQPSSRQGSRRRRPATSAQPAREKTATLKAAEQKLHTARQAQRSARRGW